MFDNIGGKIKTLAKIFCWIGIVFSVIFGIFLIIGEQVIIGLGLLFGGSILSWISSFVLYGFGELIDNSEKIKKNTSIHIEDTFQTSNYEAIESNCIQETKQPFQNSSTQSYESTNFSKDLWFYRQENGTFFCGLGSCTDEFVIVPAQHNNKSVTGIIQTGFANNDNVKSVTLSSTITTIETGAFLGCSQLKSVILPNSITEIGIGAFENCTGLTDITLPNHLTTIPKKLFKGCINLKSVSIPRSVKEIDDSAFQNCIEFETIYFTGNETDWDKIKKPTSWDRDFHPTIKFIIG